MGSAFLLTAISILTISAMPHFGRLLTPALTVSIQLFSLESRISKTNFLNSIFCVDVLIFICYFTKAEHDYSKHYIIIIIYNYHM